MLSESQERMLAICRIGKEEAFESVCRKWDLDYTKIGRITSDENLTIYFKGEKVACIPSASLAAGDGAPVYVRETRRPAYLDKVRELDEKHLSQPKDINDSFKHVFASPNIVSKRWVYDQYDYMVRTNTVIRPGGDAAVIRIKGTSKALAMKTDCNGRYVYLDPRAGAAIAVAEAARNVVCCGARPVAVTNCLNFGNPYKPDVFWQFAEAIAGMGEACRVLNTPVTGGNVSFYNESKTYQVYPTPVIGMLGLIDDPTLITPAGFQQEGDSVFLIGKTYAELGGSEYLKRTRNLVAGVPPQIDLKVEKNTQQAVLSAIRKKLVRSCHDISDGGLAVALAECCVMPENKKLGLAARIEDELPEHVLFFSESQSRFIISASPGNQKAIEQHFSAVNIPCRCLGSVGGSVFSLNDGIYLNIEELADIYYKIIPSMMHQ